MARFFLSGILRQNKIIRVSFWGSCMLKTFKIISITEGLSLIALFLIAMPAKYYFDYPDLIRPVGMTHGLLWLVYVVMSLVASQQANWSVLKWLFSLIMSVIPFGFIPLDIMINKQLKEEAASPAA